MKKTTLFLAALLLTANAALAQTTSRWGITAGANINNVHFKQSDILQTKTMWGPQVGLTGEMNFSGIGFGVEGALLYSLRQGKVNYGGREAWASLGAENETVAMHYIDVPLHLKFKYRRLNGFEENLMPLVYFGPMFSFLPYSTHRNLNSYPPVNVYLDMGLGCEIRQRVQLKAGYNFSVGQSFHTKLLDENVAKNRTWYFNVTWFLK